MERSNHRKKGGEDAEEATAERETSSEKGSRWERPRGRKKIKGGKRGSFSSLKRGNCRFTQIKIDYKVILVVFLRLIIK